ncbi:MULTISPECIES: heavy metal-binding domain-containing protein [unclassified Sphingobacterium]|uniref:heavy metal-binding domain-containing protein n=1 Tax=unclassified Sphingobacterium TaxID=2609468 RepID=UPI0025E66940|nr:MULTISPECIES: heavy metal-binding domain-containing protein [unclassified Sphingobacterium]
MIVTSTNSILPIAANLVISTNIFSDIGASCLDSFNGRSTSYEKKMKEMYKFVNETLKQRAHSIRADAIIGLSVDSYCIYRIFHSRELLYQMDCHLGY